MSRKDHHEKPYDEGSLAKLEVFENYVEAWLPTFIMQEHIKEINIVDFFSGLGYDMEGTKGSPIRILDKIDIFFDTLTVNNTIINLYLNEYELDKFEALEKNCNEYLENNKRLKRFVRIHYSNKDFNDIYYKIIEKTKNFPNLYILDQCGVEFTCQDNFNSLLKLEKTDFLFFISSSYFNRFTPDSEPEKYINMQRGDLEGNPYNFIHRIVLEKYRSLIPESSKLRIFPFSIKKGANIYGIIFGSKHILGVEKFLKIAWNANKTNGEANYDIDEDSTKQQLEWDFETGSICKKLTKIESFEKELESFIKSHKKITNVEVYYFTYSNGYISEHAHNCLRKLKNSKQLTYSGHAKISWNSVKQNDIVEFIWV